MDLYIPLMAFVTYILLCGVTEGTLSDFHPEILPATMSFGVGMLVAELTAFYVAAFFFEETQYRWPAFMDVLSLSSYKYFQ